MKKKTVEQTEQQTEVIEEVKETKVEETAQETEQETETTEETKTTKKKPEIPESVDKVLKLYPQYQKLYVDGRGFTFTPETPKAMRGDAVLYENKYYNQ